MKKLKIYLGALFLIFGLFYCSTQQETQNNNKSQNTDSQLVNSKTTLKYAIGFEVQYFENYKVIEMKNSPQKQTYILLNQGQQAPENYPNAQIVHLPISNIVVLSTKYAAFLDLLEETDKISGFSGAKYLSNPKLAKRLEQDDLQEVGLENTAGLNVEMILELNPSAVMAYDMGGSDVFPKLRELGIPTVLFNEQLEKHPLGQAEWLKFVALFFDKEAEAERIFQKIENRYQEIKKLAQNSKNKKTVFVNIPYKDIWYMPSAKSLLAQYIEDAGGEYLWAKDSSAAVLNLSFESVFDKAREADYWLNVSNLKRKEQIIALNKHFSNFSAFKKGNLFAYTKRESQSGGNDYFETGVVRPDLILSDLVKILQADLLANDSLYFYQKIE